MNFNKRYDVIIIGGGHAGCEGALAASRMGRSSLLITISIDKIGLMSCNPAIGGLAKGNLVKDLDALGGEMGKNIDATCIQFQMLNRKKGVAAQSSRGQADKHLYNQRMVEMLMNQPLLDVKQAICSDIIVENGKVKGVETLCRQKFYGEKIILTTGTFLNGKIYIGNTSISGGRMYEPASIELSNSLKKAGFIPIKLKTGTPARVRKDSIDFDKLKVYEIDSYREPFSFETESFSLPQIKCYITYSNEKTHQIVKENIGRSVYYSSIEKGIGPRYCPSMEDKVYRFSERNRHQIILEPEGLDSNEVYVNGFSTSLPVDAQIEAYRSIFGLERCEFTRPAYAIEYEGFQPTGLYGSYESKLIKGLYFAGQINGTSGYEEAAVQGFLAGVNSSLSLDNKDPLILGRDESYIGVMTDDLVTKGIDEPYRMFTSRGEYRLKLREDNAEYRLIDYGYKLGLISKDRYNRYKRDKEEVELEIEKLKNLTIRLNIKNKEILNKNGIRLSQGVTAYDFIKRPEANYSIIKEIFNLNTVKRNAKQVETRIKYSGYIEKQDEGVERFKKLEDVIISDKFNYDNISGLRREYIEKLKKIKPKSLGQALRIPGMTLSAITILDIAIAKSKKDKL